MLITKEHLSKYDSSAINSSIIRIKQLLERTESKYLKENVVFLSHSHNEKDYLRQVIDLLNEYDVESYVDWMDENMPKKTNKETAKMIIQNISNAGKFILIATNSSIDSKWCNWELGIGTVAKFENSIAILPIAENDGNWKGSEYLNIYHHITMEYDGDKTKYFVNYGDSKIELNQWLKN